MTCGAPHPERSQVSCESVGTHADHSAWVKAEGGHVFWPNDDYVAPPPPVSSGRGRAAAQTRLHDLARLVPPKGSIPSQPRAPDVSLDPDQNLPVRAPDRDVDPLTPGGDLDESSTLLEVREWLRVRLDDGVHCPSCSQMAKIYRRKVNAGMARSLATMYRLSGTEPIHVPTALDARSREEGKLAYWGLVEEEPLLRDDGGRAGWWRVTALGAEFVLGKVRIPKYARVYDGTVLGFEGDPVSIYSAIGRRFNYEDLMAGL